MNRRTIFCVVYSQSCGRSRRRRGWPTRRRAFSLWQWVCVFRRSTASSKKAAGCVSAASPRWTTSPGRAKPTLFSENSARNVFSRAPVTIPVSTNITSFKWTTNCRTIIVWNRPTPKGLISEAVVTKHWFQRVCLSHMKPHSPRRLIRVRWEKYDSKSPWFEIIFSKLNECDPNGTMFGDSTRLKGLQAYFWGGGMERMIYSFREMVRLVMKYYLRPGFESCIQIQPVIKL